MHSFDDGFNNLEDSATVTNNWRQDDQPMSPVGNKQAANNGTSSAAVEESVALMQVWLKLSGKAGQGT